MMITYFPERTKIHFILSFQNFSVINCENISNTKHVPNAAEICMFSCLSSSVFLGSAYVGPGAALPLGGTRAVPKLGEPETTPALRGTRAAPALGGTDNTSAFSGTRFALA